MSSRVRIFQTGGFTTTYIVQSTVTGKDLHKGGKLGTVLFCVTHGYGYPTAADFNG